MDLHAIDRTADRVLATLREICPEADAPTVARGTFAALLIVFPGVPAETIAERIVAAQIVQTLDQEH